MSHKHSIYDSDPHFAINAITRTILNKSSQKTILIQGDHNAERFTFEMPRYIEGHDMSQCDRVQLHYLNLSKNGKDQIAGVYEPTDFQISPDGDDVVIFSWLISANATKYAGSLSFAVRFTCMNGNLIEYAWNTLPCTSISIATSVDNTDDITEQYTDVIETWFLEIMNAATAGVNIVNEAKDGAVAEINQIIGQTGGILASETEPEDENIALWLVDLPEEEHEVIEIITEEDLDKTTSTNEFDESKLPTEIYYKVIEPEWVNTIQGKRYEIKYITYTKEGDFVHVNNYYGAGNNSLPVTENSSYTSFEIGYEYSTGISTGELPTIVSLTINLEKVFLDETGKKVLVYTHYTGCGNDVGETLLYVTTYKYEDGSPLTTENVDTLYLYEMTECYDFENLQFTTEAEGNTKVGDVFTYKDEWGNICYTLYSDYTPNIAPGTNPISLVVYDPEKMFYSIQLEALFNGGFKYSLGNKDFSFTGGKDVVANGNGAFASGKETFVTGTGSHGLGTKNHIRSHTATAIGLNNIVTALHAIAFNEGNKVLGYASLGFGDHNGLYGRYNFSGGWNNKSFGAVNFNYGSANYLKGESLVGFGSTNHVEGLYDIVQGFKNNINGNYNSVNGYGNKVDGNNNTINGLSNIVNSSFNEVFGTENSIVATSDSNIVNGNKNKITKEKSYRSIISGEGNTVDSGGYSVVVGLNNLVKSRLGCALGEGLIVDSGYGNQLVVGRYNEVDRWARVIIGNGTSDTNRSNAVVIRNDGTIIQKSPNGTKYAISVNDDGTLSTKKVTY